MCRINVIKDNKFTSGSFKKCCVSTTVIWGGEAFALLCCSIKNNKVIEHQSGSIYTWT